jgi:hypothetical protein
MTCPLQVKLSLSPLHEVVSVRPSPCRPLSVASTRPESTSALHSGAKHYQLETDEKDVWKLNGATQVLRGAGVTTYQVIDVSEDTLVYRSYLAEKTADATVRITAKRGKVTVVRVVEVDGDARRSVRLTRKLTQRAGRLVVRPEPQACERHGTRSSPGYRWPTPSSVSAVQ